MNGAIQGTIIIFCLWRRLTKERLLYMNAMGKIGFLGGGRMAEALIRGMLEGGLVAADHIHVVDPDPGRCALMAETYKVAVSTQYTPVWQCDVIILAVKPQIMGRLLEECCADIKPRHLLISIAAGIPLEFMEQRLVKGCRVVRVMPNTPALVMAGASALSPGKEVGPEDLAVARKIFDTVGITVMMAESSLDAVTGLSGSGPAYVFAFLDSLIEAGLKVGLARDDAEKLAQQTILGSVRLAMETGEHPAQLKAMVTSPGGTTIAGLHELEKAGFKAAIMNAVEAATNRSRELGKLL
jgi:pyrroline-5-carboxylate reductase